MTHHSADRPRARSDPPAFGRPLTRPGRAAARLLRGVPGLLAVISLLAGGFVVVSTLLFICEDHFGVG